MNGWPTRLPKRSGKSTGGASSSAASGSLLCVLLGVIAGTLYDIRAQPFYESISQVMIEPRQNNVLPIGTIDSLSRMAVSNDVAKHPVVLTSPQVIGRAVDTGQLADFACLKIGGR